MKRKRPVNLDIQTISMPLSACVSILHRMTGILLFLGIGLLLYGLQLSLKSPATFADLKILFSGFGCRFAVWVLLSALIYHSVAGIKHLMMDVGIGESKTSGKLGALLTIMISALLIGLAGIWLW